MTDKTKSIITHSVFGIIIIILMVIGSLYDIEISYALSNGSSFFGALFAKIAEIPAYIIAPICTVLLFNVEVSEDKRKQAAYRIFMGIMVFISFFAWCKMSSKIIDIPHIWGFSVVYSLILTAPCLYYTNKYLSKDFCLKMSKWAVYAITVMLLSVAVINILKLCWGRMRYRDMLAIGNFDGFTAWYKPMGVRKGDFTSFPSGHTASAANIFVFAMLSDFLPNKKKYGIYYYLFSIIFVILTGLARIVYNAHFLTDVIVGGVISYLCYYGLKIVFFRKGNYFIRSREVNE